MNQVSARADYFFVEEDASGGFASRFFRATGEYTIAVSGAMLFVFLWMAKDAMLSTIGGSVIEAIADMFLFWFVIQHILGHESVDRHLQEGQEFLGSLNSRLLTPAFLLLATIVCVEQLSKPSFVNPQIQADQNKLIEMNREVEDMRRWMAINDSSVTADADSDSKIQNHNSRKAVHRSKPKHSPQE